MEDILKAHQSITDVMQSSLSLFLTAVQAVQQSELNQILYKSSVSELINTEDNGG